MPWEACPWSDIFLPWPVLGPFYLLPVCHDILRTAPSAVGSGTQIPVTKNWSLCNCALKEAVLLVFVLLGCLANTKKSNTERNEQLVEVIRGLGWGVFVFLEIHCKTWENKGEVSRTQSMTGRLHGHHAPLRLSHPCGASATSGSVPIKESPWFWVPIKVSLPESWSGRKHCIQRGFQHGQLF